MQLAIDVNGNGQFEARGERFDALEPFNVDGTTYKISKIDSTGFEFAKAVKPVAAVPLPPDVGEKAPAFTAATIAGDSIIFPSRFRGKLVMLFFWAISVPESTKEIPGLVKVYEKFHQKGFEVLGISADLPEAGKGIAKYAKDNRMSWQQIFEPYSQERRVIDTFVVRFLPAAFLIDGDTGMILAKVDSLRGDKLAATIEKALAKKKGGH
jgi:peroxiredoxin